MSTPTEIYTQGYMVRSTPIGIFTQGWFSVSTYRPLLNPLDPANVNANVDASKIPTNGPFHYVGSSGGYSPGTRGEEGEPV
jgi:hypothetical protein